MSFLHVLGEIGKAVGKTAIGIAPLIPGPIGVIAAPVAGVITAELQGGDGPAKKAVAMAVASQAMPDHPNRVQMISDIIEHVVGILNIVGQFFPAPASVPPK